MTTDTVAEIRNPLCLMLLGNFGLVMAIVAGISRRIAGMAFAALAVGSAMRQRKRVFKSCGLPR